MSKRRKTNGYVWDAADDEIVKLEYTAMNKSNYSSFLPERTWEAVKGRARFLGVQKFKLWTEEEDFILETLAPIMRFKEICKRLNNRTYESVKHRVGILKVESFDKLQVGSDTKYCVQCQTVQLKTEFSLNAQSNDGHQLWCKKCYNKKGKHYRATDEYKEYKLKNIDKKRKSNRKYYQKNKSVFFEYAAKKRALKRRAVPKWYDYEKIKRVYEEARKRGWHVDHVVPLVSDKVCGLHVHDNLQLLDPKLNKIKNNHWWPEMAEEKE
jgi:hypothetical protein